MKRKIWKLNNKKGMGLADVAPVAITLVVIAIVLGVGSDVLTNVRATMCENGFSYNETSGLCHDQTNLSVTERGYALNTTQNGLQGVDELASWQDTWAIVLALAVIIGILGFLYMRR